MQAPKVWYARARWPLTDLCGGRSDWQRWSRKCTDRQLKRNIPMTPSVESQCRSAGGLGIELAEGCDKFSHL